ncbi:MAG TPA: TonB-dependent receptor, partial [Bacteroidota bacterium]|nr:TonB-dependent receptor [Bacteroidota bacterium]
LKDYGANGSLKTLSLRGTASEHQLVLVNGNRYSNFQNGLIDFSLIPISNVERIELVYGGNSALYGSDALGGVINILTRQPVSDRRVRSEVSKGSFGFERILLEGQGKFRDVGLLFGYLGEHGRDDYPYIVKQMNNFDTTLHRTNADFFRKQAYFNGVFQPDYHSSLTISSQYLTDERGAPGSFMTLNDLSYARQSDDDINLLINYFDTHINGIEFSVGSGLHSALQRYVDPNPSFPFNSFYKNNVMNFDPQVRLTLGKVQKIIVGGEFSEGTLHSNDFDNRITRVQKALYLSSESQLEFDRKIFDRFTLYQTVRYDNVSDVGVHVTPKFGINVRIYRENDVRLRMSFSKNFRSPTFNDLYYRGFSNQQLKPERSTSFDVGLMTKFNYLGEHNFDITYFTISTTERIVFDLTTFQPQNIERVQSNGLEIKYHSQLWNERLLLTAQYTYTEALKTNRDSDDDPTYRKQLIYTPNHLFNFMTSLNVSQWWLNLQYNIIGSRFTDRENTKSLAQYRIVNVNLIHRESMSSLRFTSKLEVNNLIDYNYEVFQYYPMPKRNYRFTIGVEF